MGICSSSDVKSTNSNDTNPNKNVSDDTNSVGIQIINIGGSTTEMEGFDEDVSVGGAVFSPDGKSIVVGGEPDYMNNSVVFWDVASKKVTKKWEGHTSWIKDLAFSPNGKMIASYGDDKAIRIWDVDTDTCVMLMENCQYQHGKDPKRSEINSVTWSPDSTQLASGSGLSIKFWSVQTGTCIREVLLPRTRASSGVANLSFSLDGKSLWSDNGEVRKWNVLTGECIFGPICWDKSTTLALTLSPCGTRFVTAHRDNNINFWDAQTGKLLFGPTKGHAGGVGSLAYSPDGTMVVSGGNDARLGICDATTGKWIQEPWSKGWGQGAINSLAFSPDGKSVVIVRGGRPSQSTIDHIGNPYDVRVYLK